jgi:Tfp pilus assembly protein PilF
MTVSLFLLVKTALFAGDTLDQGIKAFRETKTTQAASLLETALKEEPGNDKVHLYLGIVYQVTGQTDKAEKIMIQGIELAGPNRNQLRFNLGNLYFSRERYAEAARYYGEIIGSGGEYVPRATLNRANVGMKTGQYKQAVADYESYLVLDPETPQRGNIEKLLALLRDQITREEDQIRIAEENRIAEEKRRQEEEARQQALLNDILGDLDSAGGDTTNYTAGSENIDQDFSDSDIED